MIEALWGVEFNTNTENVGYGVVVFETGKIVGGDSSFVYIGKYEFRNGMLEAQIKVTNDHEILTSIFGETYKEFNLRGRARISDEYSCKVFIMQGEMVENPANKITVKFTRRAELP